MTNEKIIIANLKCSGCASTITKELSALTGVSEVKVDIENDSIDINYEQIERKSIIQKLHQLGYPEATEKNGLLMQLKSYGSCIVGRINK